MIPSDPGPDPVIAESCVQTPDRSLSPVTPAVAMLRFTRRSKLREIHGRMKKSQRPRLWSSEAPQSPNKGSELLRSAGQGILIAGGISGMFYTWLEARKVESQPPTPLDHPSPA